MLFITTTHKPASDLGYLLHKNPDRAHRIELPFGEALVVFPECSHESCTACVVLDVDPIGLVRGGIGLDQYVNDRPYVASSLLATALGRVFGTALTGRSKDRPELAEQSIPLEIRLPVIALPHESLAREIFEPLGYEVDCRRLPMDEHFLDWGDSPYCELTLRTTKSLKEALNHLVVLIPVLDNAKHYFVNRDEVEKLLRKGAGWLETHPAKKTITSRYLKHDKSLVRQALERLVHETDEDEEVLDERPVSLHDTRHDALIAIVRSSGAESVLDLGCGDGKLLSKLTKVAGVKKITGVDVSIYSLERAAKRLRLNELAPKARERLTLYHGSLVYRDDRLNGYDLACVVEVIEHLDPERLKAFERVVFEFAKPRQVIITTPNQEYNVLYEGMVEGQSRHADHRFEWTRAEFQLWANGVASSHGYSVEFHGVGEEDAERGCSSQMGIFRR